MEGSGHVGTRPPPRRRPRRRWAAPRQASSTDADRVHSDVATRSVIDFGSSVGGWLYYSLMCSNDARAEGDAVSGELTALLARLGELATADTASEPSVPDAARIDRIALFERIRSAVAAAQQTEMVTFARSQVDAQLADERVDPRRVGRGIADQIALACHVPPTRASRRLEVARVLWAEMPSTRALLVAGQISEQLSETIVSQTDHLDPEQRRSVDEQLAGDGLDQMSPKEAAAAVRRRAYEVDRAGYTARARKARKDRRVTLRPAPDTMSWLSVLLPVEQGAACLAALRRSADAHCGVGDEARTRDQLMADTTVERLTGQARAEDVNVEVDLVIPWDALHSDQPSEAGARTAPPDRAGTDGDEPGGGVAELVGFGPIPMGIARDILAGSAGRLWWRRLFTAPKGGALIGGDPDRRRFDGFLARLLGIRDHGRCRDPYCDAPIRHYDHIRQHRAGGPTCYANGRGVCARGNYVREMPDWRVETIHDGLDGPPHTTRTTTPTGHTYVSRAGPVPRRFTPQPREPEGRSATASSPARSDAGRHRDPGRRAASRVDG